MATKYIVYCATSPSGRKYIGCTSRSLATRKRDHRNNARLFPHYKFYRAINKYGFDAFTWSVLGEYPSAELMHKAERRFILEFDTCRSGYNITEGGQGTPGRKNTPEQSAAHAERQRRRFEREQERATTAKRAREWIEANPELHRVATIRRAETLRLPEMREHASKKQKEFLRSNQERVAAINSVRAAAVRRAAEKISRSLGGKPVEVWRDGVLVAQFATQHECARALGLGLGNIQHCLRGTRKRTGGYAICYSGQSQAASADIGCDPA